MVVQYQTDLLVLRIGAVQLVQECDEIGAVVRVADGFDDPPAVQIQTGQQGHCAQALIFVVPQVTGMLAHHGRPVRRGHRQGLNAWLFVIGDGHHAQ